MDKFKDILWPIVLVGGLGGFIDFLIGKAGEAKAKDFLLKWWVRFDDVHWRNFGREEGLFAGRLIERWFGKRIWNVRRFATALLLSILLAVLGTVFEFLSPNPNIWCFYCKEAPYFNEIIKFAIMCASFSLSISFTIFLTFKLSYLCGVSTKRNFIIFATMLFINYLIIVVWSPLTDYIRTAVSFFLQDLYNNDNYTVAHYIPTFWSTRIKPITDRIVLGNLYHNIVPNFITHGYSIDAYPELIVLFTPLLRFILSIIFIGSLVLRPLVIHPVSLIWARIIESEKPVFTVIFGGTATFATAISEAAKHL